MFGKSTPEARHATAVQYLKELHHECCVRINNGDLDIDDWIHRGKHATEELLRILEPNK